MTRRSTSRRAKFVARRADQYPAKDRIVGIRPVELVRGDPYRGRGRARPRSKGVNPATTPIGGPFEHRLPFARSEAGERHSCGRSVETLKVGPDTELEPGRGDHPPLPGILTRRFSIEQAQAVELAAQGRGSLQGAHRRRRRRSRRDAACNSKGEQSGDRAAHHHPIRGMTNAFSRVIETSPQPVHHLAEQLLVGR